MNATTLTRVSIIAVSLFWMPAALAGQVRAELHGGLTSSTFYGAHSGIEGEEKGSHGGWHFGANVSIAVAEGFVVAPGLAYTQKGVTYTDPAGEEVAFSLDYFEIPIVGSYRAWTGANDLAVDVFLGPRLSFETHCEEKETNPEQTTTQPCPSADLDDRRTTHVGILSGVGLWYPLAERVSIGLSTGFDFGLRTLDTTANMPDDIKNRTWFLRASVGTPLSIGPLVRALGR